MIVQAPFLYQPGYLTIRGVNEDGDYLQDFPNHEVCESNMLLLALRTLGLQNGMSTLASTVTWCERSAASMPSPLRSGYLGSWGGDWQKAQIEWAMKRMWEG